MHESTPTEAGGKIVTVGIMLLIVGAVLIIAALARETSVPSAVDYSLPYTSALPSRILNMGLLHEQMLWFVAGVVSCVSGAVGIFVGKGVNAVARVIREGQQFDRSAAIVDEHFSGTGYQVLSDATTASAESTDLESESNPDPEDRPDDASQVAHNQDLMVGWFIAAGAVMVVVVLLVFTGWR